MDSSSVVTPRVYEKEKIFVNTLSREIRTSPHAQTAAAKYAKKTDTIATFRDKDFETLVTEAERDKTEKNIPKALKHALDIFSKSRFPGNEKLLVLLIVGSLSSDEKSKTAIKEAAKPLQDANIKIKVVMIAPNFEFENITKKDDIFSTGYGHGHHILEIEKSLASKLKEKPGMCNHTTCW